MKALACDEVFDEDKPSIDDGRSAMEAKETIMHDDTSSESSRSAESENE